MKAGSQVTGVVALAVVSAVKCQPWIWIDIVSSMEVVESRNRRIACPFQFGIIWKDQMKRFGMQQASMISARLENISSE